MKLFHISKGVPIKLIAVVVKCPYSCKGRSCRALEVPQYMEDVSCAVPE